ncbi:uncharacterized protein C8R40DRAFT_1000153, partial [Lentinula edodes]|uniref:uncharacterized protein n=1 Tax=Lentinula edodes TaxID=5353 RepID=UPI001E8CE887
RRPTPFIGFDDIIRPYPPIHRELINFPQIIQRVDREDVNLVYDDDPFAFMTRKGRVSPETQVVEISSKVSTIVQFRAIDYGMEHCELCINYPA